MKIQDLEEKIAERARSVVQDKVATFKKEIDAALMKLFGNGSQSCERFGSYGYAGNVTRVKTPEYEIANAKLTALKIAIEDKEPHPSSVKIGWPKVLWDQENEAIRNELLSQMDLMQRMLLTKKRDDSGDVPIAE